MSPRRLFLLIASHLILLTSLNSSAQTESHLVLTSIAPIFNISKALTLETNIHIENLPERPRTMAAQKTLFSRQAERFKEQFKSADAVITMGKIWPEDSFYTTAREANIRLVNIDASKPWSHSLSGVAVSSSPVSGEVSPYFWTSPANTVRMLNIVARDLSALYPDQAGIINNNLTQQKNLYLNLKANFENKFIEVFDPIIYALTDEFTYLTNDLGIFVDDYFIKQDIDWNEQDLNNLTQHLLQTGIKVVIHKWQPSEAIQAAIKEANAQLVILDLMETSTEAMHLTMQRNLEALLNTLLAAQ